MPDNTQAIADIDEILESGAVTVQVDGNLVRRDFTELRRQRAKLVSENTATDAPTPNRPRTSQIRLGGF